MDATTDSRTYTQEKEESRDRKYEKVAPRVCTLCILFFRRNPPNISGRSGISNQRFTDLTSLSHMFLKNYKLEIMQDIFMLIAGKREKSGMCVLVSVRSLSRDTWSLQWRLKTQVSILLLPPPPDLTEEEGRKEGKGRKTDIPECGRRRERCRGFTISGIRRTSFHIRIQKNSFKTEIKESPLLLRPNFKQFGQSTRREMACSSRVASPIAVASDSRS